MNGSKTFPHDADSLGDTKIVCLIKNYGFEGYGRWWAILETLRNCKHYALNITSHVAEGLSYKLLMSKEELKSFLDYLCSVDLLITDGEKYVSPSLLKRMEKLELWIESRRQSADKRWKKVKADSVEDVKETIVLWNELAELKPEKYKRAKPYSADLNNLLFGRLSKPGFKEEILNIIKFLSINDTPLNFTFTELLTSENIFNSILEIAEG